MVQESEVNVDIFYQALHAIIPDAYVFTSVLIPSVEPESDVVATATATVSCTPVPTEYQPDFRDAPNDVSGSVFTVADNAYNEADKCQTPVVYTANNEVANYPIPITDNADNNQFLHL